MIMPILENSAGPVKINPTGKLIHLVSPTETNYFARLFDLIDHAANLYFTNHLHYLGNARNRRGHDPLDVDSSIGFSI
jgi:hypothetical protein